MKRAMCGAVVTLMLLAGMGSASAQTNEDGARIHLIHGIPGADVDIEVDGEPVVGDFGFGQTRDLSPLAGTTLSDLVVLAAGTSDIVVQVADLRLPSAGNHTILAHRAENGQPTVTVFENDLTRLPVGRGGIVVRHAAAGPPVNVLLDGLIAFADLKNGEGKRAELPEFTLSASLVESGANGRTVFGPADLAIVEGETIVIYAVGSVDDGIGVVSETIVGFNGAPTRINTGASPVDVPLDQTVFVFVMMGLVGVVGMGFVGRGLRTSRA